MSATITRLPVAHKRPVIATAATMRDYILAHAAVFQAMADQMRVVAGMLAVEPAAQIPLEALSLAAFEGENMELDHDDVPVA